MLGPINKNKRIEQIDIIRGFALFGVLLVNLTMIDDSLYSYVSSPFEFKDSMDQVFALFIHIFATGKFYSLFSILFGLGFYFFMNKEDGTVIPSRVFFRRMAALFCFGMLHLVFVWFGDILHVYAIIGVVLFLNRNKSLKSLLMTSAGLFITSTVLFTVSKNSAIDQTIMSSYVQKANEAYIQNAYLEMLLYRIKFELPSIAYNLPVILPKILSLFMFGYFIGKSRFFAEIGNKKQTIRHYFRLSSVVSLICIFGFLIFESGFMGDQLKFISVIFDEILTFSGAIFYGTSLLLLYENPLGKRFIMPLKYPGRMALTNYLTQTLFFTTIVYGYGFGYYGKIPYWSFVPIAVGFYFIQVIFSKHWLAHFNFGPIEKIWRIITYLQIR